MPKKIPIMRALKAKIVYEGYDYKSIAKALGKSEQYVGTRMRGLYHFSTRDVAVIAKLLGIDTQDEFLRVFFPDVALLGGVA